VSAQQHRQKDAESALRRLQAEHGWFRSLDYASSTFDMYYFAPEIERYAVIHFSEWTARCDSREAAAIIEYWISEGALIVKPKAVLKDTL
jgi:hypothetical protein